VVQGNGSLLKGDYLQTTQFKGVQIGEQKWHLHQIFARVCHHLGTFPGHHRWIQLFGAQLIRSQWYGLD
jgi:hypothetical protein